MLCAWIFLFLATEAIALFKFNPEDDYRCIIPPSDVVKNGHFSIFKWFGSTWKGDGQPPAGTKLLTYDLEFQCDPGFFLRGNQDVRCVPSDLGVFPECTDTCEASNPDCPVQSDELTANLDETSDSEEVECGMVTIASTPLAGGRQAIPGEVPWQAAIYDKSTSPYMQICGGSIVSKDVVISAAHCFKLPDEFYAVAVGKIYRPYNNALDRAQKSEVLEIRIPPRYRGSLTSFQDDIAAVILATPIQFTSIIAPVCLHFGADFDEVQLAPGMLGRVSGWGIDSQDGRPSQILNVAEMPIVDVGVCFILQEESFVQYITSDKICAGYTNGTSVCKGDSGGGLAVPHISGYKTKYYLRGIVSTGPPPATINECNVNAVTTFTRVAKHEYFIKSAIAKKPLQESERRTPPIIPANFISSNQNRLFNNGANEGVPLKVDSVKQIGTLTTQRVVFSNDDPQVNTAGNVVVIPDKLTADKDQATLTDDLVATSNFSIQKPAIGNFGNSRERDPQAYAPGTVVVMPDTSTADGDRNIQVPLSDDSIQTSGFGIKKPAVGNFGNSRERDPQAYAPGTVVVIPDTPTADGNGNTQVPLSDDSIETGDIGTKKLAIGNFGNSRERDPQAYAPGTVVIIPDTSTAAGDGKIQVPLRDDVETSDLGNQKATIGNFGNSRERDPQAYAPGTVVVIPDITTTDNIPLSDDHVEQTSIFTSQGPDFGNSGDSQADAPGTGIVLHDLLPTNGNKDTQDPLREDAVKLTDIIDNQRPVFNSSHDPNVLTPDTEADVPETSTKNEIESDEIPKDSFIPKPIAELDDNDKVSTDSNTDGKASLGTTHVPTVPSGDKIKATLEGFFTTSSPQLQYNAPDYSNYWPYHPYPFNPHKNWHHPSQNVHYPNQKAQYPSQNIHYPSQNVHYPNQKAQYPSQNVYYPNQNGHYLSQIKYQNPHNGYLGQDWHYRNPDWNSPNHYGN